MKKVSKDELAKILERHGRWLRCEDGGERADLSGASLFQADLAGANLTEADISWADLAGEKLDGAIMDGAID